MRLSNLCVEAGNPRRDCSSTFTLHALRHLACIYANLRTLYVPSSRGFSDLRQPTLSPTFLVTMGLVVNLGFNGEDAHPLGIDLAGAMPSRLLR